MSLNRVSVVIGIVVLCFLVSSRSQSAPTISSPKAPFAFQLVPAQISQTSGGASWEDHTVFLVDSNTGQVWEYVSGRVDKEGKYHSSIFDSVNRN